VAALHHRAAPFKKDPPTTLVQCEPTRTVCSLEKASHASVCALRYSAALGHR